MTGVSQRVSELAFAIAELEEQMLGKAADSERCKQRANRIFIEILEGSVNRRFSVEQSETIVRGGERSETIIHNSCVISLVDVDCKETILHDSVDRRETNQRSRASLDSKETIQHSEETSEARSQEERIPFDYQRSPVRSSSGDPTSANCVFKNPLLEKLI